MRIGTEMCSLQAEIDHNAGRGNIREGVSLLFVKHNSTRVPAHWICACTRDFTNLIFFSCSVGVKICYKYGTDVYVRF